MARVVVPGIPHHITQRGNYRERVFFHDDDRRLYLRILSKNCAQFGVRILGYCLLSNHVHIIALPERVDSLAKAFGRTHNEYALWMHARSAQVGHLWQNRFFSCPLDSGHCWAALRYVEQNPVRAKIVKAAWDWRWSSARAHLTGIDENRLLDFTEWRSFWTPESWKRVLLHGVRDAALEDRIRIATRTGRPLGSDGFRAGLEQTLGRSLAPQKPGTKRKKAVNAAAV